MRFRFLLATCCLLQAASSTALGENTFFEIRSSLHKRTNGVLLSATTSVTDEQGSAAIKISWTLDYTGPRQPLHILKPTTRKTTVGQSIVTFYVHGKEFRVSSPATAGFYVSQKEWFLVVPRGQQARGKILVPAGELKEYYRKKWPTEFDSNRAPVIHVQLQHLPTDRGTRHELDAWTGKLYTRVLEIKLDEW